MNLFYIKKFIDALTFVLQTR